MKSHPPSHSTDNQKKVAFQFIMLLGIASLFGDITYEGARSIAGPYLAVLGASAGIVGLVAGIGEFIGYAFRLVSGYLSDRTQRYWPITIIGYGLLVSVPILAFAGCWQLAAILIILEAGLTIPLKVPPQQPQFNGLVPKYILSSINRFAIKYLIKPNILIIDKVFRSNDRPFYATQSFLLFFLKTNIFVSVIQPA